VADGSARVPPHSLDAEAAVISALFMAPALVHTVRPALAPADFFAHANRSVYEAILEADDAGDPVDVVVVAERLRTKGKFEAVGGASYLGMLTDSTPATANVEAHARIVADKSLQRRAIAFSQLMTADGYGSVEDAREWAQGRAQALVELATGGPGHEPAVDVGEDLGPVCDEIRERCETKTFSGVDPGWRDYASALGGWERGKMHVVAGRPGMGKTAFCIGAAINIARRGEPVTFITAEMPRKAIVRRALAVVSLVSVEDMRGGRLTREHWDKIATARRLLDGLPLTFAYRPGATLADIRGDLIEQDARWRRKGKRLALGVVDYLQILNGQKQDGESREQEVSRLSRGIMTLAGKLDIPIIACSQLNRGVESRVNKNKRPTLSDLRDSGSIEQDAETVTLLYRDDYYHADSEWKGTAETIVAKNRDGKTGTARLAFLASSTAFANLANEYEGLGDFADESRYQ
jgi:replicative DNA helicase